MIYENIVQLIGKTPIVKLNKMTDEESAQIYLKLENLNPSGSIKDRASLGMINEMEKSGILRKNSVIVEPTSGNTGIATAMICAAKGYEVVLVMPESMSVERRRMLSAYGAKLVLTDASKGMKGAIDKANELVVEKGYIMLSQFDNPANTNSHKISTAIEILEDIPDLNVFIAGIGTGGTVSGVAEVLKKNIKSIEVIGIEPKNSAVINGGKAGFHKIQGIGAGFIPKNYNEIFIDKVVEVSDEDAYKTTVELAKKEGIFVGISSGAAVHTAISVAKKIGKKKKILALAPDSGNRYLSVDNLF